jgi:uncharacterized protein
VKAGALALLALATAGCSADTGIPSRPDGPVLDLADVLSATEESRLDQRLRRLEQETGDAIVLVSVESLGESRIEAYAYALFNTWGIGDQRTDRGVLILLAPREREVRIQVGCGLESTIPDAVAFEILHDRMRPFLKVENYAEAAHMGINALVARMAAPPPPVQLEPRHTVCLEQQGELV